jgi:hypothetical protein
MKRLYAPSEFFRIRKLRYLEGRPFMAVISAFAEHAVDRAQPVTVAAVYAQFRDTALAESAIGAIGAQYAR